MKGLGIIPPCVDGAWLTEYLNRADVRNALHIPTQYPGWNMCVDEEQGFHYTSLPIGSQWVWETYKNQYRMLKYTGDTDGAVPTTGSINWINSLNRTVLSDWRQFKKTSNGDMGGYVIEYDGLTLGTVHGAGHMAPQFRPEATYDLIFRWLKQEKI